MFAFPLTWFAAAIVIAALCCSPLPSREHFTVVAALGLFGLALICCKTSHLRAGIAAALILTCAYVVWRSDGAHTVHESRTARFTGIVLDATPGNGATEYRAKLDDGTIVLFTCTAIVAPGANVVVRGRLAPFDAARNPGEPSLRDIERENGVDAHIESAHVLHVGPESQVFEARFARARAWAAEQLRTYLGEPGAEIVAGELWGERGALPPDLRSEFQETGTVHVLVTAGLHVGLVAALIVFACGSCGIPRALTCALAMAGVWAFAAASGLHIPAIRAATMASMALAARASGRRSASWNTLAAAAIVVVAIQPADVSSASFWLSFCCVGAILAVASALERALEPHVPSQRVREAMVLTVATQIGTWPVTAAAFLQFTPYAILANVGVVPCVPLTMGIGAAQLALFWSPALAQGCANLNGWLIAWTAGLVRTLAAMPYASIVMTPAPPWSIALYEGALVAFVPLFRRGAVTLALALIVCATSLTLAPPGWDSHRLTITVLDVGQADAIVIETPAHHAILVDAGGKLERGPQGADSQAEQVGKRTVVPFLIRQGIHALDAILVSHPHGDHVGGAAPVLRTLGADEFADTGQQYGGFAYHDALNVLRAQGTPVVYPRAGMVWRTNDGVTLTFLGPETPFITGSRNDINNNSLVFMLQYKSFRMLFTGDAGAEAEQRILSEGVDLHADVLKVGHHGSAYSSTPGFIDAVRPQYAIISVGRHNLFGHPAPSTIERLHDSGATVYRTDENGAITVATNGDTRPRIQAHLK